jgi:ABC-2 type transport system ATP-binding protein
VTNQESDITMATASTNSTPAIEVERLSKRFGDFVAVDDLSFTVPRGSVFGFLGPNGAGKTTTIGMLLGLVPIDEGSARVLGYDVTENLAAALERTGAVVEGPVFYPYLSGRKNLEIVARLRQIDDPERIQQTLDIVGLGEGADRSFGGYSTGMRQRLGLASVLLPEPDLLVLDEPTSGLDPAGQREIRQLVRELASAGRTIFLSSHLMFEIQEICSHVAIIDRGRLAITGRLEEVLESTTRLEVGASPVAAATEVLNALPEVRAVEVLDGRLLIDVDLEHTAAVNRALVQAGVDVTILRPHESQLEERFLALTDHTEEEAVV